MKTVWIVPMIHTLAEFGSVGEAVKKAEVQKGGVLGAKQYFDEVERYWKEVGKRIRAAKFYTSNIAEKLHIFMDGVPNTDSEVVQKIIADLAGKKIPACLIIQELYNSGAKVYGTEDLELLLAEHQIWTEAAKGVRPDPAILEELLWKRDLYIAKRIGEVLPESGLGLLFIGKAHDVVGELEKLPSQFRVIYP